MGEIDIGGLIVEWDDNKAELNWKKHKIYFEDAAKVFLYDNRIDEFYEEHSDFTERGEKLRLISARNATRKEKEDYYGQFYN